MSKLKGSLRELKGCSLRYKIERTIWNLKYAWQRAWRGYDDTDIWALHYNLVEWLIDTLEAYKKHRHCMWYVPEQYEHMFTSNKFDSLAQRYLFSDDQLDAILDTMMFHFKMSDEDYVCKTIYGCETWELENATYETYKRIFDIALQNQNAALDLLKLFFNDLWD